MKSRVSELQQRNNSPQFCYHEDCHLYPLESTMSKVKSRFYIPKLRTLYKSMCVASVNTVRMNQQLHILH